MPYGHILFKLYLNMKTQCSCRKQQYSWLIGHIKYLMGLNPNFSLRILSAITVWILVSPSIWTKVKYTYYEILLYLDALNMVVNWTPLSKPARYSVSFLFPSGMKFLCNYNFWAEGYSFQSLTLWNFVKLFEN